MITVKQFKNIIPPLEDIKYISKECNWWKVTDEEYGKLFAGSAITLVAYEGDMAVGTGRIISDGIVYALFVDILVIPSKQKSGVGTLLVKEMLGYCKDNNLKMVKLLSTPKGKKLYEKFGFRIRSQEEPGMILFVKDIIL